MPNPALLQLSPLPEWDQTPLEAAFTVHRSLDGADAAAIQAVATGGGTGIDAATIARLPALEIVAVYGVGYDAVDLDACRERGIRVTNTPDVLTDDVADLAVAMMLAQARAIVPSDAWVRSGDWAAKGSFPLQTRIGGRRAGILGLGRIGQAIAHRAAAFGMEIGYMSRGEKDVAHRYFPDAVALADWADVLFVALAATPETRHIVGAKVLAALGPEGMLVNISRASNVDEAALIAALESRSLGSAALDVFDGEPDVDPAFATLPNVLLQPHAGSATHDTRRAMGQLMRDNLAAHFAGKPLLTPVI